MEIKIKIVKFVKGFLYVVYVILDVIPFSEYSKRFSNYFNNDSRTYKPLIMQSDIFSPSGDNRDKMVAKAELVSVQSSRVTFTRKK